MNEPVGSITAYFSIGWGDAHANIWRGERYNKWVLNDARWKRLLGVMLKIGGTWHVAAPRDHCKVIWIREPEHQRTCP